MKTLDEAINLCRVSDGKRFALKDHDPSWAGDRLVPKEVRKKIARETLTQDTTELAEAQQLLYAADSWAVLVIFQAMDAAGKDSTIKHVMTGVNPQGVQVFSFKHPSSEELQHDFLWRSERVLPGRGRIGIFNRSYYEDVLIVKVHPELIAAQNIPDGPHGKPPWEARYEDINAFERHLSRNGTRVLKFFLNLSKDEQRKRFLDRLNDPAKQWKFSAADIVERGFWDDYMKAYEDAVRETSSESAPWYVIPADHKWVSRGLVASILTKEIKALDLQYPKVTEEQNAEIRAARKALEEEGS